MVLHVIVRQKFDIVLPLLLLFIFYLIHDDKLEEYSITPRPLWTHAYVGERTVDHHICDRVKRSDETSNQYASPFDIVKCCFNISILFVQNSILYKAYSLFNVLFVNMASSYFVTISKADLKLKKVSGKFSFIDKWS